MRALERWGAAKSPYLDGGDAGKLIVALSRWYSMNKFGCPGLTRHHPNSDASFGDVVACAVHANVPLHCQSRECAMKTSHDIDLCINIGSMHWYWKRAIWGRAWDVVVPSLFLCFFCIRGALMSFFYFVVENSPVLPLSGGIRKCLHRKSTYIVPICVCTCKCILYLVKR